MAVRRHQIRSRRTRISLRWFALGLMLMAVATCTVRLAWLWDSASTLGGSAHKSVRIEHGLLVYEIHTSPNPPAASTSVIFNRQIDLGIVIDIFSLSKRTVTGPTGPAVTAKQQYGIATIAAALALILAFNTLRLIKVAPGHCTCGYDLRGSPPHADRCPECGELTGQV